MIFAKIAVFGITVPFLLAGCSTTGEPVSHVAQCHVKDGLLVATGDCIEEHNTFVTEIQAKRISREDKRQGWRSVK